MSTATEAELFDIFEANKEESRDTVVILLVQAGAGITEGLKLYTKFAREAGIIMSPAARKEKVAELLVDSDLLTEEGVQEATTMLCTEFSDTTAATVKRYIKTYAKDNEIEMAVVVKSNKFQSAVGAISQEDIESKDRAEVIELLQSEAIGYTANTSAGAYNKLRKHYGFEVSASMSGALTKWYTENPESTKDEILAKGEELGLAETSVKYYITMFELALKVAKEIA